MGGRKKQVYNLDTITFTEQEIVVKYEGIKN